jgi:hypothetical protein
MKDNYAVIVQNNLDQLYANLPHDLAANLPGRQSENRFTFSAFGETCVIEPQQITFGGKVHHSVLGILISLYALHARPDICLLSPLKAFKDFPNSTPYIGAFTTHTEHLLVPHLAKIKAATPSIIETLNGENAPPDAGGDFAFVVYPLPKIALCYIFYEADDDFPPSATCLFANNANLFLPIDGLADVGEYSSRKILEIIDGVQHGQRHNSAFFRSCIPNE